MSRGKRTPRTLYDPRAEHDACGVGFVASLNGPSHEVLRMGLGALGCLTHRGAVAADATTGDGAGIMAQLPHAFFADEFRALGGPATAPGTLAVGVFFLPREGSAQASATRVIETELQAEGITSFLWRPVPLDRSVLGDVASASCPEILHLLAVRPGGDGAEAFERRLYRVRRRIEHAFGQAGMAERDDHYVVSFSAHTVVYKGLVLAAQLAAFYPDLANPAFRTAAVTYHQRYSTNTTPTWRRAQPFRRLAHNGEINTLQGNVNWMRARERDLRSTYWSSLGHMVWPIIDPASSDSGMLDNAVEFLHLSGRDLCHTMMMLVPEAWEGFPDVPEDRRDFYRYHACLMEPWDGPAALVFGDGRVFGALLDRNGLRPMRYLFTEDGLVVAGSEVGVADVDPARVKRYGKLGPGQVLTVDLLAGEVRESDETKDSVCVGRPYAAWLDAQLVPLEARDGEDGPHQAPPIDGEPLERLQRAFAYTNEEIVNVIRPMAERGKENVGSMGDDTPHAVLSHMERPLFHYFKERFAEVTNPPIDHLREGIVFSLRTLLGARPNMLEAGPAHAHLLELSGPVLFDRELAEIRRRGAGDAAFRTVTLDIVFARADGPDGLLRALDRLCAEADAAVDGGAGILILSDRAVDADHVPMPVLLATAAVHHHLIRGGRRMRASLVVESGEVREIHHFATLLGYGANAVNPYLTFALLTHLTGARHIKKLSSPEAARQGYRHAVEAGLQKVMSKMGISTVESYTGAQIFEAVGVHEDVIGRCFPDTASRFGGNGFREFAELMLSWHAAAFPEVRGKPRLDGFYKFREGGEVHEFSPEVVRTLHEAIRGEVVAIDGEVPQAVADRYHTFTEAASAGGPSQLRHLLDFHSERAPVPLEEVEPASAILPRFSTGNMSLGSLSPEAHETLAIAMNRLGGRSGSGEGGEDPLRFGTEKNSAVKQVASGRFGVTPAYLASATELQIKMAQGSKPGEGGQIPGEKVTEYIARIRHTTPGVALISPPPHHDIYSIEDLAQLIYDLKQVNPLAEVSVKLVAQTGVGIIAAGVAKGHADTILISGHSGGTGSSPLNSIKNAGLPWELGLAETQQTLLAQGLRERVALRVDGGIRTGRDVVMAAMLGADQFSFGTAAMVAEGCTMMRICQSDRCPVGVATQNAQRRELFVGTPEHVMNYFLLLAHEIREILARLGYRSLDEVTGRVELLRQVATGYPSADRLDLSPLLGVPEGFEAAGRRYAGERNPLPPEERLDARVIAGAAPSLKDAVPVTMTFPIRNSDRTVGAGLAFEIARRFGDDGLPAQTVQVTFDGVAGQSFGAFLPQGASFTLVGQANDYVGKGLAGGEITLRPDPRLRTPSHEHVLLGNTVLYGATGGTLMAAGRAGERFAVRNSGATAVVEGVGDHACEYMTGGTVVILGTTGYNFGAGMTGGEAFILDLNERFAERVNPQLVHLTPMLDEDYVRLRELIQTFMERTGSVRAKVLLDDWEEACTRFVRLAPKAEVREISSADEGAVVKD